MCAFSRIPHSAHRPPVSRLTLMARDCLLAWHPSLGTALPGQARRMLLASYVLGNRCDSWLSALGMALPCGSTWRAAHPIGGYACRMLPGRFGLHLGSHVLLWLTM